MMRAPRRGHGQRPLAGQEPTRSISRGRRSPAGAQAAPIPATPRRANGRPRAALPEAPAAHPPCGRAPRSGQCARRCRTRTPSTTTTRRRRRRSSSGSRSRSTSSTGPVAPQRINPGPAAPTGRAQKRPTGSRSHGESTPDRSHPSEVRRHRCDQLVQADLALGRVIRTRTIIDQTMTTMARSRRSMIVAAAVGS